MWHMTLFSTNQTVVFYTLYNVMLMQSLMNKWSIVGHSTIDISLSFVTDIRCLHYNDVIMTTMASQITILMIAYSTVYSGADQRKHQSSAHWRICVSSSFSEFSKGGYDIRVWYLCRTLSGSLQWRHISDMMSQFTATQLLFRLTSKKHENSALLAFCEGGHRWSADSPYKGSATRKALRFHDVLISLL